MSRTRITTNVHLHEDAPPVSLRFTPVPAREGCLAFHAVQLGDLTIYADWEHLKSIAHQLSVYVALERARQWDAADEAAALTPTSTTGEAGMAAGDPIGREAAKYLAIRHDTDEEYVQGVELWRAHQEAHS